MQRDVAASVYGDIVQSLREIEATPGPRSPERDHVIRRQLYNVKTARHTALNRGATNHSSPEWAKAAILESWLMANSGAMGQKASGRISNLITAWLTSVLNQSDLADIERGQLL
jgi:hypothetical protein